MRSATTIEANGKRRKWRPIPPPNQAEAPFLVHGDDGNSGGLYDEERDGCSLPMARGVLHIGANVANEAASYSDCVGGGGANVRFAPIP